MIASGYLLRFSGKALRRGIGFYEAPYRPTRYPCRWLTAAIKDERPWNSAYLQLNRKTLMSYHESDVCRIGVVGDYEHSGRT